MGTDRSDVAQFGLVAVAQAMLPLWAYHPAAAGMRAPVEWFYANAVFDELRAEIHIRSRRF
jgi:NAD(P)H-quinone oxidoreductase subunit 5